MKKTNVLPLNEIKSSDIQRINDYLEDAIKTLTKDLLASSNGVVTGLVVSKATSNTLAVTPGVILINGLFAELETPGLNNVSVVVPGAGSKTYNVVAYYEEIEDTPSTGYVLLNVTSRLEEVQTNNTRKFGAAKIAIYETTPPANITSGYVMLATATVTTSGITTVSTSAKVFASAGKVGQISNQADNGATGIQASRTATANMLLPLDASKNLDVDTGSLYASGGRIYGNFKIDGILDAGQIVSTQQAQVNSNTIILNSNVTGAPTLDAGVEVERGSSTNVGVYWREGTDRWEFTGGGLNVPTGGISSTTASFADTVTVDKTNTKGVLFGTAASGTRLFSTSASADSVDVSSILTGLASSNGITITGSGHTRTIKNDGILSISATAPIVANTTNQATALTIAKATTGSLGVVQVGDGISVTAGGVISNADKGSQQKIFGKVKNSSGVDQFTAGNNTDSIQFGAGTGLSVAFDSTNKRVTYSNSGIVSASNGAGITTSTTNGVLTITNSDRGSSQNIFKSVANGSGTVQFEAGSNSDVVRFDAGAGMNVAFNSTTKKITFTNTGVHSIIGDSAISAISGPGGSNVSLSLNTATTSTIGGLKLGNAAGQPLGTASAGTSTDTAARVDHVHPTTGLALLHGTGNTFFAKNTFNGFSFFENFVTFKTYADFSVEGEAWPRIRITPTGTLQFGDGAESGDIDIKRIVSGSDKILSFSKNLAVSGYIMEGGTKLSDKYRLSRNFCVITQSGGYTSINIPASTEMKLMFHKILSDKYSLVTNSQLITIKKAGLYRIRFKFSASNGGYGSNSNLNIRLFYNGSQVQSDRYTIEPNVTSISYAEFIYTFAANSTLEIAAQSTVTTTLRYGGDGREGFLIVEELV